MPDRAWFADLIESRIPAAQSSGQIDVLYAHFEMLTRWNQKLNLTSIRVPEEIVIRHYCECLWFAHGLPAQAGASILDVGSGSGFPGVPIAVLRPDCRVTLVESHQRKSVFLAESTRSMENVSVLAERAEGITKTFDYVVSRAVRVEAVMSLIPKLGSNIGLMISQSDFEALKSPVAWDHRVRIPWSASQLCVYGHVPRGTSPVVRYQ